MKHIVYVIAIMITIPTIAMATDVDIEPGANATCDNGTLRTTDGDVSLRAEWEPHTITLNYYNGDTQYDSNSCTYGGGITLPDVPSRPGYSFMGWKLRMFDLTTLADYVDTGGNHFWAVGQDSIYDMLCYDNNFVQAAYWASQNCSDSSFPIDELTEYTDWKVEFSYGTVRGTARCSNYEGVYGPGVNVWDFTEHPGNATWNNTLVTDDWGTGIYCWCHITGYDDGNQGTYVSAKAPWIFYNMMSVDACMRNCAESCAEDLKNQSKTIFRQAMFGINVPEQ